MSIYFKNKIKKNMVLINREIISNPEKKIFIIRNRLQRLLKDLNIKLGFQ